MAPQCSHEPRDRKIIALVGMPGSGKSVVASYFKNISVPVIRFGEIVVNEVGKRGLPLTPSNEQLIREEIRAKYGMDACAQLALPSIEKHLLENELVVIDGLYSLSELKTLQHAFGSGLIVLAIFTPKHLRYQRLSTRKERALDKREAEQRDYLEIERIEKGGPIALADYTLLNDGSEAELYDQLTKLLDIVWKD
jgi:dephospho-CoA kinase